MSNRYLDKVAGVREVGRMARIAGAIAVKNPMTTAFGAGGAMEGALSTTRQRHEGDARYLLRGVKNTIVGAAKGAAAGKALEFGYKHVKRMAERESNQYLNKAASMKGLAKGVEKAWAETPGPTRLSLGIGSASFGVGTANFVSSQMRYHRQNQQKDLEQKQLSTLKGIHKAIVQQAPTETK